MCILYRDHSVKEFRDIITAYCKNNMKHTNTLCNQNAEIFKVEAVSGLA
jgi:hypothetical protein